MKRLREQSKEERLSQIRGREIIERVLDKAERRIASIIKKALSED